MHPILFQSKSPNQKSNPNLRTSSSGVINLALIITVSLVLATVILAIQMITLLTVRIASTNLAEKTNFYIAEGTLYDTILRLNRGLETEANLNHSPPTSDNFTINRQVTRTDDIYTVDVTATSPQASRRLQSTFRLGNLNPPDIDIALAMDSSGSMDDEGCRINNDISRCEPLWSSQAAAQLFIETLKLEPQAAQARIALIEYRATSILHANLQSDFDYVIGQILRLTARGDTNIHSGLTLARNLNWRPGSKRVIILLTDGLPNRLHNGTDCDPTYPDTNDPDRRCINGTINLANTLKEPAPTGISATIYTIGLGLSTPHHYIQAGQINLAHSILDQVASSPSSIYAKYSPTSAELQETYRTILFQILSDPYLRISECPAGGTCP